MLNKYEEYNMFLITKDNWKEQKDLFFGYKTINDNGFWLDVKKENDILTIKGSYLQPAIAIYKNNDYWAISNSVKILVDYLTKNNYSLTSKNIYAGKEDSFVLDDGYGINIYSEILTDWEEITLTPNFSYIEIKNDQLTVIKIENILFKYDLQSNYELILNWYNMYKNYLTNLSTSLPLCGQISGGTDSRFLFSMWKDLNVRRINCNWDKPDFKGTYMDGIIGRLVVAYFSEQKSKINEKLKLKSRIDELASNEENEIFYYGISYKLKDNITTKWSFTDNTKISSIAISGVGTEWFKTMIANNENFIIGTVRRFFIPKFIRAFYLRKTVTVTPYLDKSLLTLRGVTDRTFILALYLKFCPELLEIPFFTDGRIWVPSESDLENSKRIITSWS